MSAVPITRAMLVEAPDDLDELSKSDVKQRLWEESKMRAGRMAKIEVARTQLARDDELGPITEDTMLPISGVASGVGIVVAGGPGTHSVYVPSFGDTLAMTREITM